MVSRFGGDEFAVLLEDVGSNARVEAVAAKLRKAVSTPIAIGDNELHVTASIGIVPQDAGMDDAEAILTKADLALYRAKSDGRDRY